MDIHHITHRTAEECRATAELAKHASWSQAINTFHAKLDIQVMSRKNNPETPAITSRLMRKHKTVLNYLESRYADFYRRYDYAQPLPDDDPAYQGKVWLCWWQGIDNAPALVQRCVESIQRNVKEHDVIILTDENYRRYVDIPDWIVDKYRNGVFSRTHFFRYPTILPSLPTRWTMVGCHVLLRASTRRLSRYAVVHHQTPRIRSSFRGLRHVRWLLVGLRLRASPYIRRDA